MSLESFPRGWMSKAVLKCLIVTMVAGFTAHGLLSSSVVSALAAPKGKTATPGPYDDSPDADAGSADAEVQSEEAPRPRAIPPKDGAPAPVTLTAYLSEGSPQLTSDVVWRIYKDRPGADGSYKLLKVVREARPTVDLPPGEYLVNAAYGRANITKKVGVWPEKPINEDFIVNVGGLRISARLARGPIASEQMLKMELYSEAQDQFGNRQKILGDIRPGIVIRLNSGIYHVVSTYGDANSTISSDVVLVPGKITETVIDHDAGKITLKLVQRAGSEAVADTRWTIYNAEGQIIKESAGAFPTHVLAAGEYRVAAQHGDKQYGGAFSVTAGETKLVEVVMQ